MVYFDMDGVLADFDGYYSQVIGDRLPDGSAIWSRVAQYPSFFLDLPVMPGARELWAVVPPEKRGILSAVPYSIENGADHKRRWLEKHFAVSGDNVILVRGRKNKAKYAKPGYILIDDRADNIREWEEAGGIGIHLPPGANFLAAIDILSSLIKETNHDLHT